MTSEIIAAINKRDSANKSKQEQQYKYWRNKVQNLTLNKKSQKDSLLAVN